MLQVTFVDRKVCACAELPRDIREKLVSWNHTQEYDSAGYQDYASRLGGGQYEKIWDLGAFPPSFSQAAEQNHLKINHTCGLLPGGRSCPSG